MCRKKAFTLIELLVVISIIAVLLAVILPALKVAKQQAQAIVCLANLRSLSTAWYTYTGENNGKLVPGNIPNSSSRNFWVSAPQDEASNYRGIQPVLLEDELRGIERGLLYSYIKDVKTYRCPGDKGAKFGGGYRSYSITGLMNGEFKTANSKEFATKYSHISQPSEKCMLIENTDDDGWNQGAWVMNYKYPAWNMPQWIDPLAIWHNKYSTLGFADGHVEKHKWVDESTILMAEIQQIRPAPIGGEDVTYMQKIYVPVRWNPNP